MPRHLSARTGAAVCASTVVVLAATALAVAAPAVAAPTLSYAPVGDVTGDGIRDRVALTDLGTRDVARCAAVVRPGLGGGSFGRARTVVLETPENAGPGRLQTCPSRAVVSTAPRPAGNLLLAVYVNAIDSRSTGVYSLTGSTLASGQAPLRSQFGGGYLSGAVGILDFDGDGTGDFWRQGTDEGDGSAMWQRRGDTFVLIYDTGYNPGVYLTGSGLQFVDLNRAGGTDALASTVSNGGTTPFAAVVDGLTGAVGTLARADRYPDVDTAVTGYRIATVDLDHDLFPDVVVTPLGEDGAGLAPRYFLNRSQGGRWSFVALAPAASPAG